MSSVYLILPVVLPILGGALMPLLHLPERQRNLFLELLVLLTSILAVLCVIQRPADGFTMFHLTGNMDFALRLDGLGSVFTLMLCADTREKNRGCQSRFHLSACSALAAGHAVCI